MVNALTHVRQTGSVYLYITACRVEDGMAMRLPYALAYFACWWASWMFPAWLAVGAELAGPYTLIWVLAALECGVREVNSCSSFLGPMFELNLQISIVAVPLIAGLIFSAGLDGFLLTPLLFMVCHSAAMAGRELLTKLYHVHS